MWRDAAPHRADDGDLILLDDADIGHADMPEIDRSTEETADNHQEGYSVDELGTCGRALASAAGDSRRSDPEVLRAALIRESTERRRAECLADMQTEVVKLALDLLVREPDIEGFFGALTKTMVEESESHTCGVWLIDETGAALRAVDGLRQGSARSTRATTTGRAPIAPAKRFPCESLGAHLFDYTPGWTETIEYASDDAASA